MSRRWPSVLVLVLGLGTAAAGFAAVEGPTRRFAPRADALEELAGALDARERSLDRRERSVEERELDLRAVEDRLTKRATELEDLRGEIDALRAEVDTEHAARVAMVVKSVEAMKPAAAAPMIAKLDPRLAIEVMGTMNRGKAGKVLAALPPDLAARIAAGLMGPGGAMGGPTPKTGKE